LRAIIELQCTPFEAMKCAAGRRRFDVSRRFSSAAAKRQTVSETHDGVTVQHTRENGGKWTLEESQRKSASLLVVERLQGVNKLESG
jgi:hypothetical protein